MNDSDKKYLKQNFDNNMHKKRQEYGKLIKKNLKD